MVMGLQYLVIVGTVGAAFLWAVAFCPESPPP
jgi:hypothetical protein